MPLTNNNIDLQQSNSVTIKSNKRRRSDSPINNQQSNEKSILTLDQLRLKYGNLSVKLKEKLYMLYYF